MSITTLPTSELVIDDNGHTYILASSGRCQYPGCRRRHLEGGAYCHLHAGREEEAYGLARCRSCGLPMYRDGLCREHWLEEQKR